MKNMKKPNLKLSLLTRLIHKSSLHFSFTRQPLDSISDYPTQRSKAAMGSFKAQRWLPAQKREEKGDPLNSLASLCYKQEHEQLLQIIRF